MNIDYNLYKIFLYLFEEKSISKTASKLYVSQPAISYSLKELENQLGYTLFNRNSKGIEPTNEAKELYRYVSTAFNILKGAEEHIQNLNNLDIGNIRIGVSNVLPALYITEIVSKFRDLFPGIKFIILNANTSELLDMLLTKKIDIALDILPINVNSDISKEALTSFDNYFVFNKNNFNDIRITDITDLKKYNLILPSMGTNLRSRLDDYLKNKNVELDSVIEVSNMDTMLRLVNNGIGIGYLPGKFIEYESDLECLNITDLPTVDICFNYYEENLNAAVKKFIEFLINNK